jgi:hypothetical protein
MCAGSLCWVLLFYAFGVACHRALRARKGGCLWKVGLKWVPKGKGRPWSPTSREIQVFLIFINYKWDPPTLPTPWIDRTCQSTSSWEYTFTWLAFAICWKCFFGCNIEGINFCVVFLNISIIYISTPHPGTAPSIRREVPSFTPSVPILLAKLAPPHQRGRIIAVDAGEAQPKKRWTVGLMKWMDSKWFCLVLFTLW